MGEEFFQALFFVFIADLHSSLNHGLFFLGLGEVLGMWFSAMVNRISVNSSIFIFFVLLSFSSHSVLKFSQCAFLKIKRVGSGSVIGMFCLILIG